ncbi:hypothetical protein [Celeribacter baekdonensis]|uniref:hypothetical protein n=1 Tax=Celeribacter baekdonensis TaxID=875171 RepID=UPI0030D765EA|tara:strand:- start:24620 stop:25057 length:438 start_codon:yes stop_codon:yes gene_type:complete
MAELSRDAWPRDAWIDELEADLGQPAVLKLLANAGGQRRDVPKRAAGSNLAAEVGQPVVEWLSARFGGTAVDIPSLRARKMQDRAAELRAAILDAGLTKPTRSANVIATEFGVTAAWIHKLRTQMRRESGLDDQLSLPFPNPDTE